MEDEDEVETTHHTTPARLNWADLAYTGVAILSGILGATADALGYLRAGLAQHSAHIGDQQEFKRTAGRDLESLPTTEHPRQ